MCGANCRLLHGTLSSPSDRTASVGGLVGFSGLAGFAGVVAYVGRFVVFGLVVERRVVVVVILGFFVVGIGSSYSSSATVRSK